MGIFPVNFPLNQSMEAVSVHFSARLCQRPGLPETLDELPPEVCRFGHPGASLGSPDFFLGWKMVEICRK